MKKTILFASAFMALGAPAKAALVLGSNVDSMWFTPAIGSTTGWTYVGQSADAFSGPGVFTLEPGGLASYQNSFGYGSPTGSTTEIFSPSASPGTTVAVGALAPSYFYFNTVAPSAADSNRQWTNGFATGGAFGITQGDIDIFRNAGSNTWAFFFDDGGLDGPADDNDYNDLIVTFHQTVPEPMTLSLIGIGLLGVGALRRRTSQIVHDHQRLRKRE